MQAKNTSGLNRIWRQSKTESVERCGHMAYSHWFVSRQKRQLTGILPALISYSDICVGKYWPGNTKLQLAWEDELQKRNITQHGKLRARKSNEGGGGTRTLFKQMKDLGLVFIEDETKLCRLTLIAEELIKGNISFVEAMRLQLQRYQYPSAACWNGSGAVDHSFEVHPFQFLFRLLREPKLNNVLTMAEMQGIIIHYATSDKKAVFDKVVDMIVELRQTGTVAGYISDTPTKTYSNIANTFFNYISLTQYVERGPQSIMIRLEKENEVKAFIHDNPKFITHPELTENYQRSYGRGKVAKDLRDFSKENKLTATQINEERIRKEYVLLSLRTPITSITTDIVQEIAKTTGIDEKKIEKFLLKTYPHGNIDDFFLAYRELAFMSQEYATEFEIATTEVFKKIFNMRAVHLGQTGSTAAPDVFVESDELQYCGILDNKAYKKGFSLTGDFKRVMTHEYIPNLKNYVEAKYPLLFFSYISGTFKGHIDTELMEIVDETGVSGSAMPVDIFIDFAQSYVESGFSHQTVRDIFSVNREVRLADLEHAKESIKFTSSKEQLLEVAETNSSYV